MKSATAGNGSKRWNFQQARAEYERLKASYEEGKLSPGDFEMAVYNLTVIDAGGAQWQLGVASGEWFRLVGDVWLPAVSPDGDATRFDDVAAADTAAGVSAPLPQTVRAALRVRHFALPRWALALMGLGVILLTAATITVLVGVLRKEEPPAMAIAASVTPGVAETARLERTPTVQVISGQLTPTTPLDVPVETPQTAMPSDNGVVWRVVNRSAFNNQDAIEGEWLALLDYFVDFSYQTHNGLDGAHLNYSDTVIDILSEEGLMYDEATDIEVEEIFAFPKADTSGSVDIMCRFLDWDNAYSLLVERTRWTLARIVDGDSRRLDSGNTANEFQAGGWGRFGLRCDGEQVSAWYNGALLTSVGDSALQTGAWAVSMYMEDDQEESDVAFYRHRVYRKTDEAVGMLEDRVQSGDVAVVLEGGLRPEGDGYSLRLVIENRGQAAMLIEPAMIFLLDAAGTTYPAAVAHPNGYRGTPLDLPLNLQPGAFSGDVYFSGFGSQEIAGGMEMLIDPRSLGFGAIRFSLPVD